MQTASPLGKKDFFNLGKVLWREHPDFATQLIQKHLASGKPTETDYAKIGEYCKRFCRAEGLEHAAFVGPLHKTSAVDKRRLFISVILHLYHPELFAQCQGGLIVRWGFLKSTAEALQLDKTGVSKMIKQVVDWEQRYEDYRQSVEQTMTKLKKNTAG